MRRPIREWKTSWRNFAISTVPRPLRVFTSPDGNFNFTEHTPEVITRLIIQHEGYQRIDRQMSLTNFVRVLSLCELELHRIDRDGAVSGGAIVSVRELSIPRKAHDAMQKGLKLLHQESDHEANYAGSLMQFQRAIKEYPDYYEAYAQMGMAHMNLGDAASSERILRKSIALSDEQYVDAYYHAGFTLHRWAALCRGRAACSHGYRA